MTQIEVGRLVCDGMVILAGTEFAFLVDRPAPRGQGRHAQAIEHALFKEMLPQLGVITEWGTPEPWERLNGHGYKPGWREMNLIPPPDRMQYYGFVQ